LGPPITDLDKTGIYERPEITALSQKLAGEFKGGEPWPGRTQSRPAFRFMTPEEIWEKPPADVEDSVHKNHPQGFEISNANHPFSLEKRNYFERQFSGVFSLDTRRYFLYIQLAST
jgi:hypothetical protein